MSLTSKKPVVYLIGSLRNAKIPKLGARLRKLGYEVFDDWHGAGPEADDYWQRYEKQKKVTLRQALKSWNAQHVFNFDKTHLSRAHIVILVMPAGKSGHMEFGWALGQGKLGFVLFDKEPGRWDVMYAFAHDVFSKESELITRLRKQKKCLKLAL